MTDYLEPGGGPVLPVWWLVRDRVGTVMLDLTGDPVGLTLALVDIESVSGHETALCDALAAALGRQSHLEVLRDGDALVARTNSGRAQRVIVAGHIDTVPLAGNLPGRLDVGQADTDQPGPSIWGRGSVDMKGGLAVMAHLAASLTDPKMDVTWVFYDHEEVSADLSGLGRLIRHHPDWIRGDFAVLAEPTAAGIEVGCNGSIRANVTTRGRTAHSARAWLGVNAVHVATPILQRLAAYQPRTVTVDGFDYRESLNAVAISGGVASNVIPDRCTVTVNYRHAPDKSSVAAIDHLRAVLGGSAPDDAGCVDSAPAVTGLVKLVDETVDQAELTTSGVNDFEFELDDVAAPARPGLDSLPAQAFLDAARAGGGGAVQAKVGWTDVARFAAAGIPALNCGPGDPQLAHTDNEHCPVDQIIQVTDIWRRWLV